MGGVLGGAAGAAVAAVAMHQLASMVTPVASLLSLLLASGYREKFVTCDSFLSLHHCMTSLRAHFMGTWARKHWDAATQLGTPGATTTFHHLFDKRDFWSFSPTTGGELQQYGKRGKALGYLTKVRFVRYLRTPEAAELTGVDCSRPGSDASSEERMRVISNQFFELLVKYSRSHSREFGDYGNVARSRKLPEGSFCIFTGFSETLSSKELIELRQQWKARFGPPPSPEEPAPDPEPEPAPPPAPPPAPEFDYNTAASWSADTWTRFYEKAQDECIAQYKQCVEHHWYPNPIEEGIEVEAVSGCKNHDDHPLFVVQCKIPGRTSTSWRPVYNVFFKGILKSRRCGFRPLMAACEADIRWYFLRHIRNVRSRA